MLGGTANATATATGFEGVSANSFAMTINGNSADTLSLFSKLHSPEKRLWVGKSTSFMTF
jgi:hypothetical protein